MRGRRTGFNRVSQTVSPSNDVFLRWQEKRMILRLVGLICLSVLKQNSFTMRSYSGPYVMNQITTFSESLQRAFGAGESVAINTIKNFMIVVSLITYPRALKMVLVSQKPFDLSF